MSATEVRRCRETLNRVYAEWIDRARTARERRVLNWLSDGLEEDLEMIFSGFEQDVRIGVGRCR